MRMTQPASKALSCEESSNHLRSYEVSSTLGTVAISQVTGCNATRWAWFLIDRCVRLEARVNLKREKDSCQREFPTPLLRSTDSFQALSMRVCGSRAERISKARTTEQDLNPMSTVHDL